MSTPTITPAGHVPQDRLYLWALVYPAAPTLRVGGLGLSALGLSALLQDARS